MYVDSKHPYYQQFRDDQLNLDISTIDEHMQPIIKLLRDHTPIITRYCCEGHMGGSQEAYIMMTGSRDTLDFLTRLIVELQTRYVGLDEPIVEYTLEVAMALVDLNQPMYLSYTLRTTPFESETYKLLLLKQLSDTLHDMLGVNKETQS